MGWEVSPDGRRFRVYEGRCLHSDCWQARCECGVKLTSHDFDAEGARRGALEALGVEDDYERAEFQHVKCSAGTRLDAC